MRNIEKQLLLQAIDTKWRDHLEHLRSVRLQLRSGSAERV